MNILKLSALTLSLLSVTVSAQTVQFDIQNIKHDEGKVYVQLFKGEEDFNNNIPYNATIVKARKGSMTVSFSDIEPGDYAIRYFHDENNNGAMDTNLFGLPVEGFGFSNNAKVNFGPPSYQQAAFKVAQQTVKNNSTVNY